MGAVTHDTVVILDFGSQYTQLLARRVREAQVYSVIVPYSIPIEELRQLSPKGIILSGGPASVYAVDAPLCDRGVVELGVPVLGVCYGMQLMTHFLGGVVTRAPRREYGRAQLTVKASADLFAGLESSQTVWMSHGDRIEQLPVGYETIAATDNSPYAAIGDRRRRLYGVQFHPEVVHTSAGARILQNFARTVCGAKPTWSPEASLSQAEALIHTTVGSSRALCATSGGVDSTVTAVIGQRVLGERLTCLFVDTGLLRKSEADAVMNMMQKLGVQVHLIEASGRFLTRLQGVADPEEKRRRIGEEFIRVFEEEATRLGGIAHLLQGTLYPDVIESQPVRGPSKTIKTHHNVGGLPATHRFTLVEPLREMFKDEVRALGRVLHIPDEVLDRHPFPGPGLAIRVLGKVTPGQLETLREADAIVQQEIDRAGLSRETWQAFAVLLPVKSVGVMGDERTYEQVVAVRCVTSQDGMTADWARLPSGVLDAIARRTINEVCGVNRVVYDISSKPPSTIEWE